MKTKSELDGNVETPAETTGEVLIKDINGEPIDPIWAAEFRGFFWGEGTLAMQVQNHQGHYRSISVAASMGLRSDDAAILTAFQERLGGVLRTEHYRDGSGKTITRWQVGTAADNLRIAALLESPTGLPFRKARELVLWRRAVEIKLSTGAYAGGRYGGGQRAEMVRIEKELKALRKYQAELQDVGYLDRSRQDVSQLAMELRESAALYGKDR